MALGVEDWKELELFTAVGSPLDFFHGVDAFFLWAGFVVTIDVTTNPEKDIGKADIIYHEGDRMDGFVKRVVDEFNEKKLSQSHAR